MPAGSTQTVKALLVLLAVSTLDTALAQIAEADLRCNVCTAEYYCLHGERFDCPSNSQAGVALADTISECICNAGFMREGDVCSLGQPPAWYLYGNRSSCVHTRQTIASGASGHSDCVCIPGFAGSPSPEPVRCDACGPDTYADLHNMSQCTQCPAHSSHNTTQRTSVTQCICDAGYTGPDGGPCVACAAGTFKAEPGTAACKSCGANEYSSTASAACVVCHANASSPPASPGIEHCLCDPGFYPSAGTCHMCHEGRFKNTTANTPCEPCAGNTFASKRGATACRSCLLSSMFSSSTPSEGGVRCECNAGYTQAELGLTTPTCSPCGADTYQPSRGQTSCEHCDVRAHSPAASVTPLACLCNAGFFDNNDHECTACAGGTYKEAAASDDDDTAQCRGCPAHSSSLAQSGKATDCLCEQGFAGPDGGPCVACTPGKFKAGNGSAACQDCPLHTYSVAPASTACSSCAVFLASDGGITDLVGQSSSDSCRCDVSRGFEQLVTAGVRSCSACKPGTYATDGGCQDCAGGTYSDATGLTACLQCPANTSSHDSPHTACQCNKGFKCDADKQAMTFATNSTDCRCDACAQDTFKNYTGAAETCDACQAHAVSLPASESQDMCLCMRGYSHASHNNHACLACAAGTFSDTLGESVCKLCPVDTYTPYEAAPWDAASDCRECAVCNESTSEHFTDHYDASRSGLGCGLDEPSHCQPCPEGSSLFLPTSAEQRNKGIRSCVCDVHFYGVSGAACQRCPANQVRRDFINANTSLADCHCAAGFEPDPAAVNLCRPCLVGTYKPEAGDASCTACPPTQTTESTGNTSADSCVCAPGHGLEGGVCALCAANTFKRGFNLLQCEKCPVHSTAPQGSDDVIDCECAAGAEPATSWVASSPACEPCAAGAYKNASANRQCTLCQLDTASSPGALSCTRCIAGTTTDGRVGQTECVCAVGTEPEHGLREDDDLACEACRAGRFKAPATDKYAHRECVECSACSSDEQVATECNSTHDITCAACQEHSWSFAGRTILEPCFCEAGYELQGSSCVACAVGKAREANANNSVHCAWCLQGFANASEQATCHACSETCGPEEYVRLECNASRDVVCQRCQTCGAGLYANNTCGMHYGNDRLDTQCAACPADFFCPGGGVSQAAMQCPENSRSAPGSEAVTDCTCDAGFFRSGDACVLCPLDHYCQRGVSEPVACPAPGRTLHQGSAVRLDCHCPLGFFRDPPGDEERFGCSLCTRDDYCFNNSLFNCSDPLMESAHGSDSFDDCTCVSRYYNNGTRCEDCAVDHFCTAGQQHACPALEWTNALTRQDACVCRPGLARAEAGPLCLPCADHFYCDGSDDKQHACPPGARSSGATDASQCLCDLGYEATPGANASATHACSACRPKSFKDSVGNTACKTCKRCLPATDSVWTRVVCDESYDAQCESCTVCHSALAVGTEDERWAKTGCAEFTDTQCATCTRCDHAEEWEKAPCTETSDRQCAPIQRGRVCRAGEYAGNHTHSTDSECLPCAMNDTLYEGQQLHFYTSAGRRYNDATSCDIACRPFSRLRDTANPALGCVSCETGNVLFKVYSQNDSACTFTCLAGYVRRGDDCVLAPLLPSVSSYSNHTLNVTHVRRVAVHGRAAFRLTVSHTSHGSFAVVVGRSAPSCESRAHILLHSPPLSACCFAGLWRVSTNNQLGIAGNAVDTCSLPNPPPSARLGDSQLEFDVPDDRLTELALCEPVHDTVFGELACVLHVSIVDAVLLHQVSVAVPLELRRGAALAFLPGAHTYVPLLSFHVEAQLAYMDAGRPVFLVISDMVPLPAAGATEVELSAGLEHVQPAAEVNCRRYVGNAQSPSVATWTLARAPVRASTFLRAPARTSVLKLFYALRLPERETGQHKNTMNVAVWRNISLEHAVCESAPPPLSTRIGEVLSCSGLGAFAVASATALLDPSETVHGELGGLTSFVARALHEHVTEVRASTILAAFALPAAAPLLDSVAAMRAGHLDFLDTFRSACGGSAHCHFQYVHGRGVHFMSACDTVSQNAARAWLAFALGVVDDAGHVQALCDAAQPALAHVQAPHAYLIVLVNQRAYLPRMKQWHDLQNRHAPRSTSRVFALFEFV
jgi:hypothetical protein